MSLTAALQDRYSYYESFIDEKIGSKMASDLPKVTHLITEPAGIIHDFWQPVSACMHSHMCMFECVCGSGIGHGIRAEDYFSMCKRMGKVLNFLKMVPQLTFLTQNLKLHLRH